MNDLTPTPPPPPILRNFEKFLPGAFYSTPTSTNRHKGTKEYIQFSQFPCAHWVDQELFLRPNKMKSIKRYWPFPCIWAFFVIFFILEIRVAPTINWYLFSRSFSFLTVSWCNSKNKISNKPWNYWRKLTLSHGPLSLNMLVITTAIFHIVQRISTKVFAWTYLVTC